MGRTDRSTAGANVSEGIVDALVWITAALTLVSGGHYVAKGLAMFGMGADPHG